MESIDEKKLPEIIEKQRRKIKFLKYKLEAIKRSRFWLLRSLSHRIFKKVDRLEFDNPFVDYKEQTGELPLSIEYFGTTEATVLPSVDIIAINYNSQKYINGFLKGLVNLDYPADRLNVFIIDNDSTDGSFYYFNYKTQGIKNCFLNQSLKNSGFTGGNNIGFRLSKADYKLLINIDTEIRPDCLKILAKRMASNPAIGMVEARQVPNEHPKEYDSVTGETGWCSGACVLIRGRALQETGFFDEKFFHYVEDVDLSWRMWSLGWKCVYEPRAECQHFNFDPTNPRRLRYSLAEFAYGLRNGIFMRLIYGTFFDYLLYAAKVFYVAFFSFRHSASQKIMALKALVTHWWFWPHLWLRRRLFKKSTNAQSPWIKFYGMGYSKIRTK